MFFRKMLEKFSQDLEKQLPCSSEFLKQEIINMGMLSTKNKYINCIMCRVQMSYAWIHPFTFMTFIIFMDFLGKCEFKPRI